MDQPLSSDPTRLTPVKASQKPVKTHPAMKQAQKSWNDLHGSKFEQNAGRFGKKTK